jgi:hypothetical protein
MTQSPRPPRAALPHFLVVALALFTLAACESDSSQRPNRSGDSETPTPDKAVPEMEARGEFFSGQIEVEALLNRAGFAGRTGSDSTSAGNDSGGAGQGNTRGGGHRRGGGTGGSSAAATGGEGDAAPQIRPSNLPAVRLHLRLTNHGPAPITLEVTDFNSDLGNFVVEPPKILLAPKESAEAEPMTSQLGVTSDAIALSVAIWMTGQDGRRQGEKQVLTLRMVNPAAQPSPAPAPHPSE